MIRIPQAVLNKLQTQKMQALLFLACQSQGGSTHSLVECAKAIATRYPSFKLLLVDFRLDNRDLSDMATTTGIPWQRKHEKHTSMIQNVDCLKDEPALSVLTSTGSSSLDLAALDSIITQLLSECSGKYDLILLDFPPVLSSHIGAHLYKKADGAILVVEAGATRKPIVKESCARIEELEGKLLGIILNKRKKLIPQCIYRRFF